MFPNIGSDSASNTRKHEGISCDLFGNFLFKMIPTLGVLENIIYSKLIFIRSSVRHPELHTAIRKWAREQEWVPVSQHFNDEEAF